jgi:Fe-S oxidoreductase
MLGLARRLLARTLDALREEIRAGTPIVFLEPSCAAVFRDELLSFFPHDEDAKRLSKQTKLLEEYLVEVKDKLPHFAGKRKALVHGHCHQRALFKMQSMLKVLEAIGIEPEVPDDGCCGMAGSFGFEKGEHYEVSMKAGERVLLPAVRKEDGATLLIADGFSCREQVAQATGRLPLHSAEVIRMAFDEARAESPEGARSGEMELERPRGLDVPPQKDEKEKKAARDIEKGKK